MSLSEVVIEGTLKPDGTLELDQKPKLTLGRVRVVVQAVEPASAPKESLGEFLQRTRPELEEAGSDFMNEEEVQTPIEWLREPDRIDEIFRQGDQKHQSKEYP